MSATEVIEAAMHQRLWITLIKPFAGTAVAPHVHKPDTYQAQCGPLTAASIAELAVAALTEAGYEITKAQR